MTTTLEAPVTNPKTGERFYPKNGRQLVSVTTVIGSVLRDEGLEKLRGHLGNQATDAARDAGGDLGTKVHHACAMKARGDFVIPMELPPKQQEKVDAFERWRAEYVDEILVIEMTVYSEHYGWAGTLDYLLRLKGDKRVVVADVKSGIVRTPNCRAQTAAYMNGDDMDVLRPERRIIIDLKNINAQGMPKIVEYDNHLRDYHAFLHLLNIFHWRRSL